MALFGNNFLTKLEFLSIVSRRVFRGQLMAQRRTMQAGSGIEFADHRPYTHGDDFRYLDWNLYARHDELLLKRFQEEEDLHVYFLLDSSRSMSAGDPAKFDLARQVTAALAYVALSDLDRISVFSFAGSVLSHFPLTRGKARILRLMQFLEELNADGTATRLTSLAKEFVLRVPRRGLVVVLSDFYDPAGYQESMDVLRHHRFEPHIIQFHASTEAQPKLLGDVELHDVETDDVRKLTVAEQHLEKYREVFRAFLKSIRDYCSTHGIGCTITSTENTFDQLVLGMLRTAGNSLQ